MLFAISPLHTHTHTHAHAHTHTHTHTHTNTHTHTQQPTVSSYKAIGQRLEKAASIQAFPVPPDLLKACRFKKVLVFACNQLRLSMYAVKLMMQYSCPALIHVSTQLTQVLFTFSSTGGSVAAITASEATGLAAAIIFGQLPAREEPGAGTTCASLCYNTSMRGCS